MAVRTARKIYNDLARYFGLREQDAFLSAIENSTAKSASSARQTSKDMFFQEIFGDGVEFMPDAEIYKLLNSYGKNAKIDVCVTPADEQGSIPDDVLNVPGKDQGWGKPKEKHYGIYTDVIQTSKVPDNAATVYQVFPAARGHDIADTEIITLFMSNLTSLEMSRAVPYIDITVSSAVGDAGVDKDTGNFVQDAHFSLGKFLGAGISEKALRGKFLGKVGTADTFASSKQSNLQAVSSMEVFTSPQTMVAADRTYEPGESRPIDKFRPFLSLDGIEISIVPTAFGTISHKSAKLNMKLFDRGRLQDIAPLVSPQRKGNVQFYITYGWSHPDGQFVQRGADASQTKMGDLINAMRISESYIVTNSSFEFESDGTVAVSVDLAMVGTGAASATDILSVADSESVASVMSVMHAIQKKMRDIQKRMPNVSIPQIVMGISPENVLNLTPKDKKALKKASAKLRKSGTSLKDVNTELIKLIGVRSRGKKSLLDRAEKTVKENITDHIDYLRSTPDPFLRPTKRGVTSSKLNDGHLTKGGKLNQNKKSKRGKQAYISFGKLMTHFLTPVFSSQDNDLQLIFTPFNSSAGAMYDHNISQFPIDIDDLRKYLVAEAKKKTKISAYELLQFVEKYFLSFQGSSAYGLSDIYQPDKRDDKTLKAVYRANIDRILSKKGNRKSFNNKLHENLRNIYEMKRIRPTFRPPHVTMNIVTRKSSDNSGKNITRVTFFDAAAGQVMPIIDTFNKAARLGHFVNDSLNGPANERGARHGETSAATYKTLRDRKLTASLADHLGGTSKIDDIIEEIKRISKADKLPFPPKKETELRERLNATEVFNFKKAKNNIKELFFEFAPSLIYGSAASGILSANLSSQQNDALTSIALTKAITGKDGNGAKEDMSLPLMIHPTTLRLETFGCPYFRMAQKFFVDMGTNTSADNFYAVTSVNHTINRGEFKTNVDLIQTDAFGSFVHVDSEIEDTIVTIEIANASKRKKS